MKIEMSQFYGNVESEKLMEWIEDMEGYFDFHEIEGSHQVKIS